ATYRASVDARSNLSKEELVGAMGDFVGTCMRRGAPDAFVGFPNANYYEFFRGGERFRGIARPALYWQLLELLRCSGELAFHSKFDHLVRIRQLRGASPPVLYISWEHCSTPVCRPIATERHEPKGRSGLPVKESQHRPSTLRPQIYLVDDDACFCEILGSLFARSGLEVVSETNAERALSSLTTGAILPDMLICDANMPGVDGLRFVRQLRQKHLLFPVMMLTSDSDPRLEAEAACGGADLFQRKNQDPRTLMAWCRNLISRGGEAHGPTDAAGAERLRAGTTA
ncbi:MAG: response regulator, partial [Bdellovibrionales bacterium]|nr:response regulator [Bdellovibrionales bacterium]